MQRLLLIPFFGDEQMGNEGDYDVIHITDSDDRSQNVEYEVVDLTENEGPMMEAITQDFEVNDLQSPLAVDCSDDLQFPIHLFASVGPEWMHNWPEDTDTKRSFKIKYLASEWVGRTHGVRHFRMHSSRRKGLLGTKK